MLNIQKSDQKLEPDRGQASPTLNPLSFRPSRSSPLLTLGFCFRVLLELGEDFFQLIII